ncbi:Survival protein SurE-like phosphatase/nucleotidase [Raphanus sativus]|nr:Survival protein SurE-like phosphatase/nucleotidase [Raphanus sativus]
MSTSVLLKRTPVDCISLGLSGAKLFAWSKPTLVTSGINQRSGCGYQMFYSGAVAGAREGSLDFWSTLFVNITQLKDESQENDFKDAVGVCLPLINALIRDIEKGIFPKRLLSQRRNSNITLIKQGFFKVTKQSMWRQSPSWQAVSANCHPGAGNFMSNQQSLGAQLAQLGRDASCFSCCE